MSYQVMYFSISLSMPSLRIDKTNRSLSFDGSPGVEYDNTIDSSAFDSNMHLLFQSKVCIVTWLFLVYISNHVCIFLSLQLNHVDVGHSQSHNPFPPETPLAPPFFNWITPTSMLAPLLTHLHQTRFGRKLCSSRGGCCLRLRCMTRQNGKSQGCCIS